MAGALRVKSGRPSEDLKNDPLLVQNFYNISAAIKRELKVDANEQILAEITYKLQLFMEVFTLRYIWYEIMMSLRIGDHGERC